MFVCIFYIHCFKEKKQKRNKRKITTLLYTLYINNCIEHKKISRKDFTTPEENTQYVLFTLLVNLHN